MKQAQVIWLDQALTDLEVIYDFIAEDSPAAAQRIVTNILDRAKQLETFPESGAWQELKAKPKKYRYLVEGHYKIIYSFKSDERIVHVYVVFDSRLNPEKLAL